MKKITPQDARDLSEALSVRGTITNIEPLPFNIGMKQISYKGEIYDVYAYDLKTREVTIMLDGELVDIRHRHYKYLLID